ncbi:MAG: hypothetical protein AB1649_24025, partial [Chloroflexota bacterium]
LVTANDALVSWPSFLSGLVLSAGIFVIAFLLQNVTDYPFSLGWSEGNRLWDYSVLFGRRLYDYPADQPISVLLDIGRQFIGGIPFLLPGLTIFQARLWVALTYIIPFLLCGWLTFRLPRGKFILSILAGLWAFTFLQQGPIHPPLILCAILVALAWRQPVWLAIPLIMAASYFAQVSRWTWMFAPGLWIIMLEFGSTAQKGNRPILRDLWRPAVLGLSGFFAGYLLPFLAEVLQNLSITPTAPVVVGGITPSVVVGSVGSQALLWYRLLPNATYGNGILVGLMLAVLPLLLVLFYLSNQQRWYLNIWQKLALVLPLLAFLVVGLIISVKIGGGGDLHNMDMFLIGLMFAGAIAWRNYGHEWILNSEKVPLWLRAVLVAMIIIPAYRSLMTLRPISFAESNSWVSTLTDVSNPKFLDSLPSDEVIHNSLETIRREVDLAHQQGGILFMDQRQLLTFGYLDVPLVPDYDKKVLINNAMSADQPYFQQFYADLAVHRFALIITSPLYTPIKDSSYQFGEENNAWVEWVSNPVLCYYEEKDMLKEVNVQLLVPRSEPVDCSDQLPLPEELQP